MRRSLKQVIHGAPSAKPLRIAWVSDTHVHWTSDGDPDGEGAVLGSGGTANFRYQASWRALQASLKISGRQPDCYIHTGDATNLALPGDWDLWMPSWEEIEVPKAFTPGNTDFSSSEGTWGYSDIVEFLGYDDRDENGGSVFNFSFSLTNGETSVRMITLDTTVQENGARGVHEGYLTPSARSWLQNELLSCPENVVLIWSHHGPHSARRGEFDSSDMEAIKTLVKNVYATRKDLKVKWFFGHEHQKLSPYMFQFNDVDLTGFCSPALVQYIRGRFSIVNVQADGHVWFENLLIPEYPEAV